jgi:hypothetical protein
MFGRIRSTRRSPQSASSLRPRLGVNCLEDRSMPSVTASLVGSTLLVSGSSTDPYAHIRIEGQDHSVWVMDGDNVVAAFRNVNAIDARPDADALLAIDLGTNRDITDLSIALGKKGVNTVSISQAQIGSVSIVGGNGADTLSVGGLNATKLTADLGAGQDRVIVGRATIGQLTVHSAEAVYLLGTSAGNVALENRSEPMTTVSTAQIGGSFSMSASGGSLSLGGDVGGSVAFENDPKSVARATLNVTGQIDGPLHMSGTSYNDSVVIAPGSHVAGNLGMSLGEGNDDLTLAGSLGDGKSSTMVVALGDGEDRLTILGTATIKVAKSWIDLGAGNDWCTIRDGAYVQGLNIDGGAGKDVLDALSASEDFAKTFFATGFEVFI